MVDSGNLYSVNLNQTTLSRKTVATGMTGMKSATFAVTPLAASTCGNLGNVNLSYVLAAEPTRIRQLADPRITLTPSEPLRVWISKLRSDDIYPSPLYQSTDHQITITATVTPIPSPVRNVCFRVVDPPDTGPYATTGWCDNQDTDPLAGTFTQNNSAIFCIMTDTNGVATVTLNTTARYAGDNYIVQATFDDWATSNTTKALAQTGIITAWKRTYIEKDKMFRKGGLLFKDSPIGSSQIEVYPWTNVSIGDSVLVFDETKTAETGGETRIVLSMATGADGSTILVLDNPLSNAYLASSPQPPSPGQAPDFINLHSGGVGVPSAGYFDADMGNIWQPFNDAFVEYWSPPDGANALPFLDQTFFDAATANDRARFS